MYSPAMKLQHLFGKVQSLPSQHQERAIIALADIVEDFYPADEELPRNVTAEPAL
jgi:hypothetical protein